MIRECELIAKIERLVTLEMFLVMLKDYFKTEKEPKTDYDLRRRALRKITLIIHNGKLLKLLKHELFKKNLKSIKRLEVIVKEEFNQRLKLDLQGMKDLIPRLRGVSGLKVKLAD